MLAEKRAAGAIVVVDAGGSLSPPPKMARAGSTPDGAELEQRRAKADLIARAFALGGIDAMALGPADWTLGTAWTRSLAETNGLPVLAANLTCDGVAPWPGTKRVEAGGFTIGIVGVTLGPVEGCEVTDPVEAIRAAGPSLEDADLVLALVPVDSDRAGAELWAATLPVDLAIDARGRSVQAGAERRADSWWLSAGSRGKTLGFLDLAFVPDGTRWVAVGAAEQATKKLESAGSRVKSLDQRIAKAESAAPTTGGEEEKKADIDRLRKQREAYEKQIAALRTEAGVADSPSDAHRFSVSETELGAEVADHPDTAKLVEATKVAITALAPSSVTRFVARVVTDPASPFAGGEACVGCHAAEHAQWATTGHARAWQALVDDQRANDDDCWSCHVTGAGAPGGPATPAASGGYRDVQCEACHGPGRAHVADPAGAKLVGAVPVETCRTCHDGKQDGGRFDPATYLPKVSHGPPEAVAP